MYFFSFIYNMLKCQKEEKGFCKTQKYELQLLPAACCFQKNELELFLEDWPRRPPSSPDASGLPAFPPLSSIFFTSFPFSVPSIFQFLCRQLTYTACNTSSLVLPVVRTLRFHHFSFEAFSFFRKSLRLLPALAGHILPAAFLPIRKPEPRAPACRPLLQIYHTYLTYKSQTLTFGSAGQHHSITNHSHRRPPPSPDASGLPPFPSTLPQPSTPPISHFFFFLSSTLFLFLFFFFLLSPFSFFLLFIIFSLHFLFLAFFYLLFCFFHFFFLSIFFIISPCTFFMCTSPKDVKQNAVM